MDSTIPPPRRRLNKHRLLGYGCVLGFGILAATSLERTSLDDMETVITMAATSKGRRLSFHHSGAALNMFPGHGYTLTIDIRGLARFQPGWFLTVTRIKDHYMGEIISGVGERGLRVLRGSDLAGFLERTGFSFESLDSLFVEHFKGREVSAPRTD